MIVELPRPLHDPPRRLLWDWRKDQVGNTETRSVGALKISDDPDPRKSRIKSTENSKRKRQ